MYQLWAWNNLGLGIDVKHIIMNADETELMVNSLEHCRLVPVVSCCTCCRLP